MPTDPTWDFRSPASRERLLGVVRQEMQDMLSLAKDPACWDAPTACTGWQVRDVIGHLVDTTEGYLPAFELARSGGTPHEALGLRGMAVRVDEHARSYRKVPQTEMLDRLHDDMDRMMNELRSLSDDDWTGFLVPHVYMGPVPAMFYAEFQLVDYAVHNWDIREGIGRPHGLSGDAADLLVPLIFILWQATCDTSGVERPFTVGIRTSGHNGGDVRVDVSADGVQYAEGDLTGCEAVLEFDPATFVLAGYGRTNGGTVRGDTATAARFRSLFFPI